MVAASSPSSETTGRAEIPPPPAPLDGYVRAAVVQLNYHPSALVGQFHLLEQPAINAKSPNWYGTPQTSELRRVRQWETEIAQQIRRIYVEQEAARLSELLRKLAEWRVDVVVLPEYSVAPECLEHLAPLTGNMLVVFGTHTVEPRLVDDRLYERLGVADPECGTAVAPVAIDGVLRHLQPKLNKNYLETGMTPGGYWSPIDIPRVNDRRMGILVCLDFLHREAPPYRNHVGEKIDACHLIAVPSLTPDYTIERFEARAIDEKKGYGRSVLYADVASGGGSTVFVDSALARPSGVFPFGIPSLARGEEGVIVVDIDIDYTCVAELAHRRYSDRAAALPVAAATLRYPVDDGDFEYLAGIASVFKACDFNSRSGLARTVREKRVEIEALADRSTPTVQQRLNGLVEHHAQARNAEEILCRLRDITFSEAILPLSILDELRLRTARDLADAFKPTRAEEAAVGTLRQRLAALCTEDS